MALRAVVIAAVLGCATAEASAVAAGANPIRKVVTMLQSMQAKVEKEGKKEQELYEKFMCYCKTGASDLSASIDAASGSISQLGNDIKSSTEAKAETEADLKSAQDDRVAAKAAMSEATAIREKEAAAFATEKAEYEANIAALTKATAAVEKGSAGAFIQSRAAGALRRFVQSSTTNIMDSDRETIMAFLQGGQNAEYAPQSGEIVGILKQLGDELSKGLSEATATENASVASYGELMSAKTKEVAALSASIEAKLERVAELGVSIAQMKNDLGDTEEALLADQAFLAEMDSACKTKTAEWEEIKKVRSEELLALADTIKILNDDDALDLFKKTLPSASSAFLQMHESSSAMRAKALAAVQAMRKAGMAHPERMDLIMLALRGKKIGFEKVIKMIDEMVVTLKTEQTDDDNKKVYCAAQFDKTDDEKKALERLISDKETAIATATESIKTLEEEIAALQKGISELDKSVAEATEQRKEENAEYSDLMAGNSAAKELLGFAKNRLNKFYNPKLYKAPKKEELSADDRIVANMGGSFAQIRAHLTREGKAAPPPPPETFGPYTKKSEESTGVIAMIDMLVADLDKEMTEGEAEEKNSQGDYEAMMADSATKRTADSKSITEKEGAKADTEALLEKSQDEKTSASKELMALDSYIATLHAECDWLIKYYDMRSEARTSEIDALGKAKAVLSGADYSLLQTGLRLRR